MKSFHFAYNCDPYDALPETEMERMMLVHINSGRSRRQQSAQVKADVYLRGPSWIWFWANPWTRGAFKAWTTRDKTLHGFLEVLEPLSNSFNGLNSDQNDGEWDSSSLYGTIRRHYCNHLHTLRRVIRTGLTLHEGSTSSLCTAKSRF